MHLNACLELYSLIRHNGVEWTCGNALYKLTLTLILTLTLTGDGICTRNNKTSFT